MSVKIDYDEEYEEYEEYESSVENISIDKLETKIESLKSDLEQAIWSIKEISDKIKELANYDTLKQGSFCDRCGDLNMEYIQKELKALLGG